MKKMIIVKTLVSDDGVVGLNGYRYLLNEDSSDTLKFSGTEDATQFLLDNGSEQEWIDENVEFETLN